MASKPENTRELPRSRVAWEVLMGEASTLVLRARGWTEDISHRGCRIVSDETIDAGKEVRVLIVAGKKIMHVRGEVVRSACLGDGEFELGVRFDPLSERNIGIIGEFSAQNP